MMKSVAPGGVTYPKPDAAEISAMLSERMETLAVHLVGAKPTSRYRNEIRFGTHNSLSVKIGGPFRGTFIDYENGPRGDAIDLIRHMRGCGFKEALAWAQDWLGTPPTVQRQAERRAPVGPSEGRREPPVSGTVELARTVWAESTAPRGTVVEQYLQSRGLHLEPGLPVRFHPACPRGPERLPAMLALMTDAITDQPVGVHRTFLTPDGRKVQDGRCKMMAGRAGVIRLSPDSTVTTGIGIAEGIETGLSVMQVFGWRPIWAAASAGGISRFPVLNGVEALTVFADGDIAGMNAATEAAERWLAAGRNAEIRTAPGGDFADAARSAA